MSCSRPPSSRANGLAPGSGRVPPKAGMLIRPYWKSSSLSTARTRRGVVPIFTRGNCKGRATALPSQIRVRTEKCRCRISSAWRCPCANPRGYPRPFCIVSRKAQWLNCNERRFSVIHALWHSSLQPFDNQSALGMCKMRAVSHRPSIMSCSTISPARNRPRRRTPTIRASAWPGKARATSPAKSRLTRSKDVPMSGARSKGSVA